MTLIFRKGLELMGVNWGWWQHSCWLAWFVNKRPRFPNINYQIFQCFSFTKNLTNTRMLTIDKHVHPRVALKFHLLFSFDKQKEKTFSMRIQTAKSWNRKFPANRNRNSQIVSFMYNYRDDGCSHWSDVETHVCQGIDSLACTVQCLLLVSRTILRNGAA